MTSEQRLVAFFGEGAKGAGNCGCLGLEVEHFVVAGDGQPVAYEPKQDLLGIRDVLEHLLEWYPKETRNEKGDLLGIEGLDGSVTLEPAAQLEMSVAPFANIEDIMGAYGRFRMHVGSCLLRSGALLINMGYHPSRRADELTLIPKRRYDFMDAYFSHIGSDGMRMMRASASTQVSIDFADEADAVRKMRVASALSPVLAAIADNTPVFEDAPNHTPIRRLQLWREVDHKRCGTIPGIFDDGYGFASYARWLLSTPPIFVTRPAADDPAGPSLREAFDVPAFEAYADAPMLREDVEHLTSMFWPDVRLKKFVEIRPADCLPQNCIAGYVALIKGIFYSERSLVEIEHALGVDEGKWHLSAEDVEEAIRSVQAHGHEGVVYGESLRVWETRLFELARAGLPAVDQPLLDQLEQFAAQKPWWKTNE